MVKRKKVKGKEVEEEEQEKVALKRMGAWVSGAGVSQTLVFAIVEGARLTSAKYKRVQPAPRVLP